MSDLWRKKPIALKRVATMTMGGIPDTLFMLDSGSVRAGFQVVMLRTSGDRTRAFVLPGITRVPPNEFASVPARATTRKFTTA